MAIGVLFPKRSRYVFEENNEAIIFYDQTRRHKQIHCMMILVIAIFVFTCNSILTLIAFMAWLQLTTITYTHYFVYISHFVCLGSLLTIIRKEVVNHFTILMKTVEIMRREEKHKTDKKEPHS